MNQPSESLLFRVNGIPLAEPHSLQLLAALAETPALTTVCQRLHIPAKRAQDTLDGLNNLAGVALTPVRPAPPVATAAAQDRRAGVLAARAAHPAHGIVDPHRGG